MTYQMALFASLMLAAGAPCGAQPPSTSAPASNAPSTNAPATNAPAESATSSANPSSSAASSSTNAPATTSKPASSATEAPSSEPSAEVMKEARREGFKPKKRDGVTMYCYTDATLGTKFVTEKCFDQHHMEMLVQQREDQRNQMKQPGACGGADCSGH
jgi:hypothetical protein